MPPQQHPNQEPLFLVADRTSQMAMPDFTVDVPEHVLGDIATSIHYINALNGISEINSRLGFVAAAHTRTHRPRLEDEYGRALEGMTEGARKNVRNLGNAVKWAFARATNMFDQADQDAAKQQAREEFSEFREQYDGTGKAVERTKRINFLRKNIDVLLDRYTEERREKLVAEKSSVKELLIVTDVEADDDMQLDTPERMRVIAQDPRTGFLPTNNTEKNVVLAFLDYIDNPAYQVGINNQFHEIFNHQERVFKNKDDGGVRGSEGNKAVVSITHMLSDFYVNSQAQLQNLQELQIALAEPFSPHATVLDLINNGQISMSLPGYTPLARFMDMKEVMKSTNARAGKFKYSPLAAVRNEQLKMAPGKNKVVEDRYTGVRGVIKKNEKAEQAFDKRIRYETFNLSVKDARKMINEAVANEEKRYDFMWRQMNELSHSGNTKVRHLAQTILAPTAKAA